MSLSELHPLDTLAAPAPRVGVYDLAVVGLGYVGLPLAREATDAGLSVVGLDLNQSVVTGLAIAHSTVDDVSPADLDRMHEAGFEATSSPDVLSDADAIVICVPTPLSASGGPDLTAVRGAVTTIGQHLRPGTLVVLESTTYPGTTQELVAPLLAELSGLRPGVDFHLAFSPERVDPGNARYGIANTPRIVGGLTPECTARAAGLYERFVDRVLRVPSPREAETAKLLENTYRQVNLGLVNELTQAFHELGIDVWDVIGAAETKPFGFQAFRPGPGVGGHCIPIDPMYLSHHVRERLGRPLRFVELAQEVNNGMPAYVARRAQDVLNDQGVALRGASVLLLGVSYKADIGDDRESPARPLAQALIHGGAAVSYHDPHIMSWMTGVPRVPDDALLAAVRDVDLVILVQNHAEYHAEALARQSRAFFDTRGATTSATARL